MRFAVGDDVKRLPCTSCLKLTCDRLVVYLDTHPFPLKGVRYPVCLSCMFSTTLDQMYDKILTRLSLKASGMAGNNANYQSRRGL